MASLGLRASGAGIDVVPSETSDTLILRDRLVQVAEIGEHARDRGLQTVYLTDENKRDLAHRSVVDGARLLEPASPADAGRPGQGDERRSRSAPRRVVR